MQLTEFWNSVRAELLRANADRRHAFRTFVLATKADFPAQRTLVKRKTLDDLCTLAYTDRRTPKVQQLENDPRCSLHFYDSRKKLQVIIESNAEIIDAGPLFETHQQIALINPKDYSTQAPPGTELSDYIYRIDSETYFALLKFNPETIQVLQLGGERHLRAKFVLKGSWQGQWLVP